MFIIKFDNAGAFQGVKSLEKKYHISLPATYTNFLLDYNGGYTPQTKFSVTLPQYRITVHSDLVGFYGVAKAELNFSIIEKSPFIKQALYVFHCFPVGVNTQGELILIGVGEDNMGQVFMVQRTKANRIVPVAKDFLSFTGICKSKKVKDFSIAAKQEELILRCTQEE